MSDERRLPGSADVPSAKSGSDVRLPSAAPESRPVLPSDTATPCPAEGDTPPAPTAATRPASPTPVKPRPMPTPGRPSMALSLGPSTVDPDLAERIRQTTAQGGLTALPETWGDEDGDWRTITSPNQFEILYLDYRNTAAITPQMVERHHDLIREFWKKKDADMSRGAGAVRERYERTYGRDVPRFPGFATRAFQQLTSDGGIAAEASRLNQVRREIGEAGLARAVAVGLGDGLLTVTEADEILKLGLDEGLTREETATYVQRVLGERGFEPESKPTGSTAEERLLSVRWMTAIYRAEAARAANAIKPMHFGNGITIRSLADLVDACDAHPKEAADYLFGGYFESWLSKEVSDISLAKTADETKKEWSKERAKGLEKFVRAVSGRADRPERPVIAVRPPQWSGPRTPMGGTATMRFQLDRQVRPVAWGTIARDESLHGLAVPSAFRVEDSSFEVSLTTLRVPPGRYWGRITVQAAGGTPVAVPVEYEVLPLTMLADPPMVDFGDVKFGAAVTKKVTVTTTPAGGYLEGVAEVVGNVPGVAVAAQVQGSSFELLIAVDTKWMLAGSTYKPVVRVLTTAGSLDVPVTVRVKLNTALVVGWSLGGAFLGAGALAVFRGFAENVGMNRWQESLAGNPPGESLVIAAITVAATAWIARAFWKRRKKSKATVA